MSYEVLKYLIECVEESDADDTTPWKSWESREHLLDIVSANVMNGKNIIEALEESENRRYVLASLDYLFKNSGKGKEALLAVLNEIEYSNILE